MRAFSHESKPIKNILNKWHVNIITDNITDIQSILKFATCIYIQQMMLKQNNTIHVCEFYYQIF